MPFVVEPKDEEIRARFHNKIVGPVYASQATQIIDRERDLVLLDLGGRGDLPEGANEPPDYFNLMWKGIPIPISGYHSLSDVAGVLTVHMRANIGVPGELKDLAEDLQSAFCEALSAYWTKLYRRPINADVQFHVIGF